MTGDCGYDVQLLHSLKLGVVDHDGRAHLATSQRLPAQLLGLGRVSCLFGLLQTCWLFYTMTGSWYTPNTSRNTSVISPSVA